MNLSFLYRSHFSIFHPKILHTYTSHPCLLVQIFSDLFKTKFFEFFKNSAYMETEIENAILYSL